MDIAAHKKVPRNLTGRHVIVRHCALRTCSSVLPSSGHRSNSSKLRYLLPMCIQQIDTRLRIRVRLVYHATTHRQNPMENFLARPSEFIPLKARRSQQKIYVGTKYFLVGGISGCQNWKEIYAGLNPLHRLEYLEFENGFAKPEIFRCTSFDRGRVFTLPSQSNLHSRLRGRGKITRHY